MHINLGKEGPVEWPRSIRVALLPYISYIKCHLGTIVVLEELFATNISIYIIMYVVELFVWMLD